MDLSLLLLVTPMIPPATAPPAAPPRAAVPPVEGAAAEAGVDWPPPRVAPALAPPGVAPAGADVALEGFKNRKSSFVIGSVNLRRRNRCETRTSMLGGSVP